MLCHVQQCQESKLHTASQLQNSEYRTLGSSSQPEDHKKLRESGGERSKQSFISLKLCYSVLALRNAQHKEYLQSPQTSATQTLVQRKLRAARSPSTGLGAVYASREAKLVGYKRS